MSKTADLHTPSTGADMNGNTTARRPTEAASVMRHLDLDTADLDLLLHALAGEPQTPDVTALMRRLILAKHPGLAA
jgi:hypothetical protein